MSVNKTTTERPFIISLLVLTIIVLGLLNLIYSFTGIYAGYGLLYSAAMSLLTVISVAALSAIWGMEKWGVYLYSILTILKLLLDFYVGALAWWSIFFLFPIVVFWILFRKMK